MQSDGSLIRKHMDVVSLDGKPFGKVDQVEGDRIKLTRTASSSQSTTHTYIDLNEVLTVQDDALRLKHAAADVPIFDGPV